jgi:methylase of polypeptide subunit release factors
LVESKTSLLEEINAGEIAEEIRKHASRSRNEEELKIRVESLLRLKVFDKLGIPWASYEHRDVASGERKDAFYGTVIIEYKDPGKLDIKTEFNRAKEKVKEYIIGEAKDPAFYGKYFGVILDGFKIAFLRYRKGEWEEQEAPFEINARTITRLLEVIRGLKKKPIDAEFLLLDFGPRSETSRRVISVLYEKVENSKSERTEMLFEDWKRVFSQVCAYSPEKLAELTEYYGIKEKEIDVEKLLFSIHTYYTLLMKLLTSEVITLFTDGIIGSYLKRLEDAYYRSPEELLNELKDLEEGGIFNQVGIKNFLEADYFAWYLDEWDEKIASSIIEIVRGLLDYEPATVELDPDRVKDLFKRLYQDLVPKKVRHDLGEYFTPDWLAELLLNEVGYDGNPEKRVLDPACGSGTFLVLAIKRVKDYAEEHFLSKEEVTEKILRNIVGFDLNPLAVLASRANYIIALGDLIRYRPKGGIEIPVYLADSVLVTRKVTLYGGKEYVLTTRVGDFWVPVDIVKKDLLPALFSLIDQCAKYGYEKEEFEKFIAKEKHGLSTSVVKSLGRLYEKVLKLERTDRNRIWTRLLKNSFAPLLVGKFDYIIGNPPWVNWENLPVHYRKYTKDLWKKYGLAAKATAKQFELGKMKRDISMLFVYRCSDYGLKDGGILGFLITQMVFKTKGAEVFRRFKLPDGKPLKVLKVHDMVTIKPFEGVANMTSMIILKKGEQTVYPVPYVRWIKVAKGEIGDLSLQEAYAICSREELIAKPIDDKDVISPWLTVKPAVVSVLSKVRGASPYKANLGVNTGGANGVYWIKILEKTPSDFISVENLHDIGKKRLRKVLSFIEPDLVYKLIRSGDINRWNPTPVYYIVVPHTEKTDWQAIPESVMKIKFPRTYAFLSNFKDVLLKRSAYVLLRKGHPFYIMVDIRANSFAPFKVAWKRMGDKIEASVLGIEDDTNIGKKPLIPQETVSFIPLLSEDEAHYLCAILNSVEVNLLVKSFSQLGGKSFATPSVLDQINIPKFDSTNIIHMKLSELSKKAHKFARQGVIRELKKIEEEIDKTVAQLYGITDRELKEIKKH